MVRQIVAGIGTVALLALAAGGSACGPGNSGGSSDAGTSDARYSSPGERLYRAPYDAGNSFTCSTCHALKEPAEDGFVRPGHPIGNATRRPSYKNGQFQKMLPAVNSCREEWMNLDPWEASDEDWKTLHDWLDSQATTDSAEPIEYTIADPPADLSGGDPEEGRRLFNNGCAVCHGKDGQGTSKGIALDRDALPPSYVARRVRKSGEKESSVYSELEGGQMPFWSKERLPNQALRHIVAYVGQADPSGDTGTDAGVDSGPPGDTGSPEDGGMGMDTLPDCKKPSCKVGWTAELQEEFHNVGGTAEMVDKRTIVIRNFTYDGRGIVVKAYGAPKDTQKSFVNEGFPLSENLKRSQPYQGEKLTLKLPDGSSDATSRKTLLDVGAISIWCVDVGQNFGSGTFTP